MSAAPFDGFVILAAMRTGSNLLESLLAQLDGVRCHGELFNPVFIGAQGRDSHLGFDLAARDARPLDLLAALRGAGGLPGFRLFHDHDARVLAHVLADRRWAKIVLNRNPLESYVSLGIARATGQWMVTGRGARRSARMRFEPEGFAAHLQTQQGFQRRIQQALQTSGQTAFFLHYDDLGDVEVLNGLAAWLGLSARLARAETRLRRQNPEPLTQKVTNPEEMAEALAAMDRFDLTRTPDFGPRPGPRVPRFLAAARAPVLLLPLPGGPEAALRDWLAALDGVAPEALRSGFSRASLAEWQRANPGHRALAVLRHPLARAWAAFSGPLLGGRFPHLRDLLRRDHGLALAEGMDRAALRADFLGFLRFLRANLEGRTALRVDPLWAAQGTLLRGIARVRLPDLLLREEDAATSLSQLAEALGRPAPPAPVPPAWPRLAALCDPEIEAAARAAYRRDYLEFGFGDWR